MGETIHAAMVVTRSIRKDGIRRNELRTERSRIRRFGPSFLGTMNRREKNLGSFPGETSLMMLVASNLGINSWIAGICVSCGRHEAGGTRESGGSEWNFNWRPMVMMSEATGSFNESQASLCDEMCFNQLISS